MGGGGEEIRTPKLKYVSLALDKIQVFLNVKEL